jgi:hypothetical protein
MKIILMCALDDICEEWVCTLRSLPTANENVERKNGLHSD